MPIQRFPLPSTAFLLAVLVVNAHNASDAVAQPSQAEMQAMYEATMGKQQRGSSGSYGPSGQSRGGRSGVGGSRGGISETYLTPVTTLIKGIDVMELFSTEAEIEVQAGPILANDSKSAFEASYAELARQLIYAHMTTEFDDASATLRSVKYSPLLKRPTWNIRCGVSLAVRGDDGMTDFHPIEDAKGRSGRSGQYGPPSGMSPSGMSPSGVGGPPQGFGGPPPGYGGPSPGNVGPPSGYGGPPAGYGGPGGSAFGGGIAKAPPKPSGTEAPPMLSESTEEEMQKYLGFVATQVGKEFDSRFQSGEFGSILTEITPPKTVENNRGFTPSNANPEKKLIKGALGELLSSAPEPLPMWRPGFVYLGVAPSNETMEIAKSNNIDLLFHFDISVKEGRGNEIQNTSRLRLINVATGKSLGTSKAFDSAEVEQLLANGQVASSEVYIKDQLSAFWKIFEREVKAVALPKLNAEVAKRRIAQLFSSRSSSPLETLAEIRMYQAMDLISAEEAENAFFIVGGSQALVLMHGPLQERMALAREWALEAIGGSDEG